ncbi:prohibitin-2-like [Littorina saxatilis]|uniref:Band 7 domain-containing protein n=1 Tax=Littorina saxatilis TaxID=31220 RepID=A0AAN9GM06_9CAEN
MAEGKHVCCVVAVIVGALVIMTIALLATSLKKLASDEVGIQYDTIQKELGEEVFTEGLHTGPPGYEFLIFPSVYTTLSYSRLSCLNSDGVPIRISVSFQFKAMLKEMKAIILDFKDFDGYKDVLRYSGEAVIHEACSKFNTSQFQAERGNFQTMLSQILRERYTNMKADVTDLQVNNIERPNDYEAAIRSKERAREDIQVAKNERPRLITEANTTRRNAESEAQIILNKANSDARIMQNNAEREASSIVAQYDREAEAYESIVSAAGLGFTPEGFISYLGVRVIASAKNPVYIGLQSPAKTTYTTN